MFLINIFVVFIYQPLLNLLVIIYDGLEYAFPQYADMGIAVVVFTIIFRILWLPISLSADRTEREKRKIADEVAEIKNKYSKDPIERKKKIRALFRSHPGPVAASAIDLFFQVLIALMLYRMFSTGLGGSDSNLLYKFLPQPDKPFNLMFLGQFDLTKPSIFLNLLQSLLILVAEIIMSISSPFPITKRDLSTIIFLPIISFFIFIMMPAGKKLFIISTIAFTIVLILVKQLIFLYHSLNRKLDTFTLKTEK